MDILTFYATIGCHFGIGVPDGIPTASIDVISDAGSDAIVTAGLGVICTHGLGIISAAELHMLFTIRLGEISRARFLFIIGIIFWTAVRPFCITSGRWII